MVAGSGDCMLPNQRYEHPDSPVDGAYVQSQLVSFERIKLTNNDKPRPGQVGLLQSCYFVADIAKALNGAKKLKIGQNNETNTFI